MDGILGFFSPEAGQARRRRLDELGADAMYYVPPELRGLLGLLAEANPVEGVGRAGQAAQELVAPGAAPLDRVGAGGRMLSEMAGVVAPAMVASRAAMPAAQAIQEGLLGFSAGAQDVGRAVVDRLNQPGPMPTVYSNPIVRDRPGIMAYHGSPHDFDRFSMEKIGTGEGAQAYGHGLYFAEAEDVAGGYRDRIAGADWVDGRGVPQQTNSIMSDVVDQLRKDGMGLIEAEENASFWSEVARKGDAVANLPGYQSIKKVLDRKGIQLRPSGSMYEVRINANPEDFLDWDKPLSEQPNVARALGYAAPEEIAAMKDQVRAGLAQIAPDGDLSRFFDNPTPEFDRLRQLDSAARRLSDWTGMTGQDIGFRLFQDPAHSVTNAKEAARSGIPGIKYLDAGSRGAGDGSRNYVVFDDRLIEIVRKYGIAAAAAMLGMSQADLAQAMEQQPQPQGLLE